MTPKYTSSCNYRSLHLWLQSLELGRPLVKGTQCIFFIWVSLNTVEGNLYVKAGSSVYSVKVQRANQNRFSNSLQLLTVPPSPRETEPINQQDPEILSTLLLLLLVYCTQHECRTFDTVSNVAIRQTKF